MSILSTIITLPFIVLASIPLILFSLVTIPLAITGLLLRVLIVYLELGIALLRGYLFFFPDDSFSYPGASSTSFLTFSAVTTPGAGLPISKGSNTGDAKSDDYFGKIQRVDRLPPSREATSFSNFISGDEDRDFEGVGGWRSPVLRKKPHLSSAPSSIAGSIENVMAGRDDCSYSRRNSEGEVQDEEGTGTGATDIDTYDMVNEIDVDADASDEQAWLSLNQRLELPAQSFSLTSKPSLLNMATGNKNVDAVTERRGTSRPRHHRRSLTTSSLSSVLSLSPYYHGIGFRRTRPRSNSGSGSSTGPAGEQLLYPIHHQHQSYQPGNQHSRMTGQSGPASVSYQHSHHEIPSHHHSYSHDSHHHHHQNPRPPQHLQNHSRQHIPPIRALPIHSSFSTKGNTQASQSPTGLELLEPLPPLSSSFLTDRPDLQVPKISIHGNSGSNVGSSSLNNNDSYSNGDGGTATGTSSTNPSMLPISKTSSTTTNASS